MAVYRIDLQCDDPQSVLDWIAAHVPPAEIVRTNAQGSLVPWGHLTVVFKRAEDAEAFQKRWRPGAGDVIAPFGSVDLSGRGPRDVERPRPTSLPRVSGLKLTATDKKLLGEVLTHPWPADISSRPEAIDLLLSYSYVPLEEYLKAAAEVAGQRGAAGPAALSQAMTEALAGSILLEAGIARRFLLDDPAEIARFTAVGIRTEWMLTGAWAVLDALAIGDELLLDRLLTTTPFSRSGEEVYPFPLYYPWLDNALLGILRGDVACTRDHVTQLRSGRLPGVDAAVVTCLEGILAGSEVMVAEGLKARASAMRKVRKIAPHFKLLDVGVHGLFELCRRLRPALVAQWDTAAGLPWDAAFHTWRRGGHDPLRGVDWSGVPEGYRSRLLELPIADRAT